MNEKEVYMHHCMKLRAMLEADHDTISSSLQGDLLQEYKELLEKEMEVLYDTISQIKYI